MRTEQLKYVDYRRKSSESDLKQISSIEHQSSINKRVKDYNSLTVVEVLAERKSAWTPGIRPEFIKMIRLIQQKKANAILTTNVDRLARNLTEADKLEELIKNGKLKEIRTPDRVYSSMKDLSDLVGKWGAAAQYSINLSSILTERIQEHLLKGKLVNIRTGYKFNLVTHILEPDPITSEHVKMMFQLCLNGNHSVETIRKQLKDLGVKSKGGNFYGGSTINRILRNPIYYGATTHKGIVIKETGLHQQLITKAEFEIVQDILDGRHRPKKQLKEALFRGKAYCNECFCTYTFDPKTNRHGKTYNYYHCSNGKKFHSSYPKAMVEKKLIDQLAPYFFDLQADKETGELALMVYIEELKKGEPKQDNSKQIEKAIVSKKEELKKLRRKFNLDDFTKEEYDEMKQEIDSEIIELEKQLNNTTKEDLQVTFELLEDVKTKAFSSYGLFSSDKKDIQKNILDSVVSNFLVGYGKIASVQYFPEYEVIKNTPKTGDFNEWRRVRDSNP